MVELITPPPDSAKTSANIRQIGGTNLSCHGCNKTFKRSDYLKKHVALGRCNKRQCPAQQHKNAVQKLEQMVLAQQKRIEELEQVRNTASVVNNNTNCNNTINVTVNNFGKETTDHIDNSLMRFCVERMSTGLLTLVQKLYYDPEVPQNHTITMLNKREPYLQVRERDKWVSKNKNDILERIINKVHDLMQRHFDEFEDVIRNSRGPNKIANINMFFDKLDKEEDQIMTEVKRYIIMLIINNRHMCNV